MAPAWGTPTSTLDWCEENYEVLHILIVLFVTSWRTQRCPPKKNFEKILKKIFRFFLAYNIPGHLWVSPKNFSPIGPVVWPAIRNKYIYMNVLFYYIDYFLYQQMSNCYPKIRTFVSWISESSIDPLFRSTDHTL